MRVSLLPFHRSLSFSFCLKSIPIHVSHQAILCHHLFCFLFCFLYFFESISCLSVWFTGNHQPSSGGSKAAHRPRPQTASKFRGTRNENYNMSRVSASLSRLHRWSSLLLPSWLIFVDFLRFSFCILNVRFCFCFSQPFSFSHPTPFHL